MKTITLLGFEYEVLNHNTLLDKVLILNDIVSFPIELHHVDRPYDSLRHTISDFINILLLNNIVKHKTYIEVFKQWLSTKDDLGRNICIATNVDTIDVLLKGHESPIVETLGKFLWTNTDMTFEYWDNVYVEWIEYITAYEQSKI